MPIPNIVQSADTGVIPFASSTVAKSYASAQNAGDTNIILIEWQGTATISSVKDNSVPNVSYIAGPTLSFNNQNVAIYYLQNITSAGASSRTITTTFSASVLCAMTITEIGPNGGASLSLDLLVGTGSGTTVNPSYAGTTADSGELVLANFCGNNSGVPTAGSGWTAIGSSGGSHVMSELTEDQSFLIPGTITISGTGVGASTSGAWASAAIGIFAPPIIINTLVGKSDSLPPQFGKLITGANPPKGAPRLSGYANPIPPQFGEIIPGANPPKGAPPLIGKADPLPPQFGEIIPGANPPKGAPRLSGYANPLPPQFGEIIPGANSPKGPINIIGVSVPIPPAYSSLIPGANPPNPPIFLSGSALPIQPVYGSIIQGANPPTPPIFLVGYANPLQSVGGQLTVIPVASTIIFLVGPSSNSIPFTSGILTNISIPIPLPFVVPDGGPFYWDPEYGVINTIDEWNAFKELEFRIPYSNMVSWREFTARSVQILDEEKQQDQFRKDVERAMKSDYQRRRLIKTTITIGGVIYVIWRIAKWL